MWLLMLLFKFISIDSSVGRVVDCRILAEGIRRSLVQIRLEGKFLLRLLEGCKESGC